MSNVYCLRLYDQKIAYFYILFFCLDLAQRVDAVKDENVKLKSENQVCLLIFIVR